MTRGAKMTGFEQFAWMIDQNWWQDAALSAGNIFFSLTLIPMFRHPGKPPLLTSIPNAFASLAGAFVFGTLHLWVTAVTLAITGVQWFVLAFKKYRQNPSSDDERGSGVGWPSPGARITSLLR